MKVLKLLKDARGWVVLGVLMIGVGVAPASWTAKAGIDVWNIPKLEAEIAENERFSKVMDAESEVLTHRIQTKDILVKELLAGRVSFAAVTDQFQTLNSDDPEVIHQLKLHYHLQDDRTVSALNVLAFAGTYLESNENPATKPVVLKKLDDEFERLFPNVEALKN